MNWQYLWDIIKVSFDITVKEWLNTMRRIMKKVFMPLALVLFLLFNSTVAFAATISGQVFAPGETPQPVTEPVQVIAIGEDNSWHQVDSDSDGNYLINNLQDNMKYRLYARLNPNSQNSYANSYRQTFLLNGSAIKDLTLTNATVTGYVYAPGGSVITSDINAMVDVFNSSNNELIYSLGVRGYPGFESQFNIGGLEPGSYYLRANYFGPLDYTWSFPSDTINVDSSGTVQSINMQLTNPTVMGRVYEYDNTVVTVDCSVSIESMEHGYGIGVKNDGTYKAGGIPDGTYDIYARKNGTEITTPRRTINIVSGQMQTVNLTFPDPNLHSISGQVVNGDNQGVSGIRVEIYISNGPFYTFTTDANGYFQTGWLENDIYNVRAIATSDSVYSSSQGYTVTVTNNVSTPVILELTVPQISGVVVDPDGNTVSNTAVDVFDMQWNWITHIGTDETGRFKIGGLAAASYKIAASEGNTDFMRSDDFTVNLTDQSQIYNDIELRLNRAQIKGMIRNPDGSSAQEGYTTLRRIESQPTGVSYSSSSGNGEFKLRGLNDGTYELRALSSQSIDVSSPSVIVVAGSSITINGQPYTSDQDHVLQLAAPQVTGSVVNPDAGHTPVNSSRVEIFDANHEYIYDTRTGNSGTFGIGGLIDGTYTVKAYAPNGSAYSNSVEYPITIADGVYTGALPFVVELTAPQVLGRVLTPLSEPVANAWVEIRKASGDWIPGVSTDDNGYFRIGGLADGKYILKANRWNSEYTPSNEVDITIENGQCTSSNIIEMNLTLPQIEGIVLDPSRQQPAQFGYVEVRETNGMYVTGNSVEGDGTFKLSGLQAGGNYLVKAYPNMDSAYTASNEMEITVPLDGSLLTLELALTQPQVDGFVTEPSENPLAHGWVEIQNKINNTGYPGVNVFNGDFKLGGLEDGTYILKAHPDQNSDYSASRPVEITIAGGVLTMKDGQTHSGRVDLVLSNSQINGLVVDGDGNPVSFGWVDIQTADHQWIPGVGIDENGAFKIGGLDDGTYYIRAYPNGGSRYVPSDETAITISGGVGTGSGELVLQLREPQLSGRVVSPDGEAQPYGYIDIRLPDGRGLQGAGVDYEGNFSLGGLEDGTYLLKANPSGDSQYSASGEIEIQIADGAYAGGELIFVLQTPQITGVVKDPDNHPVAYAWVNVQEQGGKWVTGAGADENGVFRIGSLDASRTYVIKAYPGWNSEFCDSDPMEIAIDANGNYTGGNITLNLLQAMITGQVRKPDGSASPFGWIEIQRKIDNNNWEWVEGTGVDETGKFRIKSLPDGIYRFKANPNWDSQYTAGISGEIIIVGAVPQSGPSLDITLTDAQINGMVKDPTGGSNVGYGWVEVRKAIGGDQWEWVGGSSVDYNGNFRIGSLTEGTYVLKAYPDWSSDFSASDDMEVVIDSSGDCTTNGGNIVILLSRVQIEGTVVEPGGSNARYGWLEVQKYNQASGEWDWVEGTGYDWYGSFKLGGLADGTYRLKAYPEFGSSFTASEYTGNIDISGGAYNGGELLLTLTQPRITGLVRDPSGEPVQNGWVEVRDAEDNFITGTGVRYNGAFALGGLADGVYKIRAYPAWGTEFIPSEEYTVNVSGNIIDITLNLRNFQISGTVKTPDGSAIFNKGWIEVYSVTENRWVTGAGIEGDGAFHIGGLSDGQYTIRAFAEAGSVYANSESDNFTITGGNADKGSIEIRMTEARITGTVNMPDGSPADGGWVEVGDLLQTWMLSVPVAADGSFKLPGLAGGDYTIQAFRNEGAQQTESVVSEFHVDAGGNSAAMTLQLN